MIVYALIKIAFALVSGLTYLFLLLPVVTLPPEFGVYMHNAMTYALTINTFFPVQELFEISGGVFLVYETAYFLLKLVNWTIRKIPGIS